MKKIYIIPSKTPTTLARSIRFLLRTEYSHVSIAFDKNCEEMYSFGRINPNNPFKGGFVKEGKNIGFFNKFSKSEITIFEKEITDEQYEKLRLELEQFENNNSKYSFNVLGLMLAGMQIPFTPDNKFFCSQFVSHLLKQSGIYNLNEQCKVATPMHFPSIPNLTMIFKGKICDV